MLNVESKEQLNEPRLSFHSSVLAIQLDKIDVAKWRRRKDTSDASYAILRMREEKVVLVKLLSDLSSKIDLASLRWTQPETDLSITVSIEKVNVSIKVELISRN